MEISPTKPAASPGKANGKRGDHNGKAVTNGMRKSEARSRVTNGQDVLPGVDNRSMIARRYYDIQSAIVVEQGSNQITETRLQLIRRFAAAAVLAEALEAKLANGEEIDIAEHSLLVSSLVRLSNRIGLDRISKDVTTVSVREIIAEANGDTD